MNDDMITVGGSLPKLVSVIPLEGRKVRVTFDSGEAKVVDLAPALESRRIYIPLRSDDELFKTLRVSEFRNSIEWNDELDFSATWLAKLPSVEFDNEDFRSAMDELGMTLDGMALALEVSRRQVADYRKEKNIPRSIAFATRYLVERHEVDERRYA